MEKENIEEYMELFYRLDTDKEEIKTNKIASEMKTTKGNVSQALKKMKTCGLINYEPYQKIQLTEKGKKIGNDIFHKHEITEKFLGKILGVTQKRAHEEACKIEHAVSQDTIKKLSNFMKNK